MSSAGRTVLAVALVIAALPCGPADATTVGGSTQTTNGSFVLAGGRIVVPTYVADDPGMASPGPPGCCSTSTPGVLSFGAGSSNWSVLDLASNGYGTPVLASSGKSVAIAWLAHPAAITSMAATTSTS